MRLKTEKENMNIEKDRLFTDRFVATAEESIELAQVEIDFEKIKSECAMGLKYIEVKIEALRTKVQMDKFRLATEQKNFCKIVENRINFNENSLQSVSCNAFCIDMKY